MGPGKFCESAGMLEHALTYGILKIHKFEKECETNVELAALCDIITKEIDRVEAKRPVKDRSAQQ